MTDRAEPFGPALFNKCDLSEGREPPLAFSLGLRQADRALPFFPLSTLLKDLDALEAFHDGAIAGGSTADFETIMLGHGIRPFWGPGS